MNSRSVDCQQPRPTVCLRMLSVDRALATWTIAVLPSYRILKDKLRSCSQYHPGFSGARAGVSLPAGRELLPSSSSSECLGSATGRRDDAKRCRVVFGIQPQAEVSIARQRNSLFSLRGSSLDPRHDDRQVPAPLISSVTPPRR